MQEQSNLFVVLMGVGIVFLGLICIVFICKIMSAVCNIGSAKTKGKSVSAKTPVQNAKPEVIENRQEIIAAVSAAVAEELGTDISAIRILSFKRI